MARDESEAASRASRCPKGTTGSFAPFAPLAPLIAAVVVSGIAFWFGPRYAGTEFFAACAGVIPILLLGLALEARALRPPVLELGPAAIQFRELAERCADMEHSLWSDEDATAIRDEGEIDAVRLGGLAHSLQGAAKQTSRLARTGHRVAILYALVVAALLLAGELVSLTALSHDDPSAAGSIAKFPFAVVASGFTAIVVAGLLGPFVGSEPTEVGAFLDHTRALLDDVEAMLASEAPAAVHDDGSPLPPDAEPAQPDSRTGQR